MQLQEGQLLEQGDQDHLFGQRHGADKHRKKESPAGKLLFGQRVSAHGGGDTGQPHGSGTDQHGVDEPGQCRPVKQLVIVPHGDDVSCGEPDRDRGVHGLLGFKGAGDDPVKREDKQQCQDDQEDDADHVIRRYLMNTVIRIVLNFLDPTRNSCGCFHDLHSFHPLSLFASLN